LTEKCPTPWGLVSPQVLSPRRGSFPVEGKFLYYCLLQHPFFFPAPKGPSGPLAPFFFSLNRRNPSVEMFLCYKPACPEGACSNWLKPVWFDRQRLSFARHYSTLAPPSPAPTPLEQQVRHSPPLAHHCYVKRRDAASTTAHPYYHGDMSWVLRAPKEDQTCLIYIWGPPRLWFQPRVGERRACICGPAFVLRLSLIGFSRRVITCLSLVDDGSFPFEMPLFFFFSESFLRFLVVRLRPGGSGRGLSPRRSPFSKRTRHLSFFLAPCRASGPAAGACAGRPFCGKFPSPRARTGVFFRAFFYAAPFFSTSRPHLGARTPPPLPGLAVPILQPLALFLFAFQVRPEDTVVLHDGPGPDPPPLLSPSFPL